MKRSHRGPRSEQRAVPHHTGGWRLAAAILGLALLVIAEAVAAQVYKWKDEHGVTHYGDTPPARGKAELLQGAAPAPPQAASQAATAGPILPYELARAAQAAPVLLYTTARCDACDQGRALLRERGIPFTEYTVSTADDEKQLHQVSGGKSDLPLLLVGSRKLAGFQAAAWQEALSAAAYPRQKMLPPGYQYAAPQAAGAAAAAPTAPVRAQIKMPPDEAAAQAAGQQPRAKSSEKPPASGSGTPPDIQF
jgi:glutaredoxin